MGNQEELTKVFQQLLIAYNNEGVFGLNFERVKTLFESMETEMGFFTLESMEQVRQLRFMEEIHLRRGEMHFALKKIDSSFWKPFAETIDRYIDGLPDVQAPPFPF